LALYIVVQQVENNLLVPFIMKKSVGFPPLLTIVILMVGGRLAGAAGAILSVPIALVVQEMVSSVLFKNAERELKQATKKSL
jgi:predicted PurR-regulated permease PerM